MLKLLARLLVNAAAIWAASYLIDGVNLDVSSWWKVAIVAAVFGVTNALLKPLLKLLSMPFILVTLGFFTLVINALLLGLTAYWTDALTVSGFGSAFWGALVTSLVSWLLGTFVADDDD